MRSRRSGRTCGLRTACTSPTTTFAGFTRRCALHLQWNPTSPITFGQLQSCSGKIGIGRLVRRDECGNLDLPAANSTSRNRYKERYGGVEHAFRLGETIDAQGYAGNLYSFGDAFVQPGVFYNTDWVDILQGY